MTSSRGANRNAAKPDSPRERDSWTENIHMRTSGDEDPQTVSLLAKHRAALDNCDKYIDFVHHVEGNNIAKYERNIEEIKLMNASGVTNSQKYAETKFAIGEYEEELEQRDMTPFAKTTQSLNVQHSEVSCIGSKTCAKQKTIHKLFPEALKTISASQPVV